MKIRYLTLLTTLVFLGFTVSAFAKGKPPKPPVDDAVVYTVELTGVFNFPAHDVTLNSKGRLNSVDTLVIEGDGTAWDGVFTSCAGFTPTNSLMKVNFDDWGVGRNGDDGILWISFANIRLPEGDVPEKEIQIQLQRRFDSNPTFLPTDSDPEISFLLDYYVVWGKPLSGKGKNRSWDTCYQSGDGNNTVDFLPAELVIAISKGIRK
jgi:hypothetical protein